MHEKNMCLLFLHDPNIFHAVFTHLLRTLSSCSTQISHSFQAVFTHHCATFLMHISYNYHALFTLGPPDPRKVCTAAMLLPIWCISNGKAPGGHGHATLLRKKMRKIQKTYAFFQTPQPRIPAWIQTGSWTRGSGRCIHKKNSLQIS